jgi:hypothetical protein
MGLSFVDPKAAPIASLIDEAMGSLPKRGLLRGRHLMTLQGLVSTLKDSSLLLEHGQKVLSGQSPADILSLGAEAQNALGACDMDEVIGESEPLDDFYPFDSPTDDDGQDLAEDTDCPLDPIDETLVPEVAGNCDEHDNQAENTPFMDSLGLW